MSVISDWFDGLLSLGAFAAKFAAGVASIYVANGHNTVALFAWTTTGMVLMLLPDMIKYGSDGSDSHTRYLANGVGNRTSFADHDGYPFGDSPYFIQVSTLAKAEGRFDGYP